MPALLRATRVRIVGREATGVPVATMESGAVKAAGTMTGVMAGTGITTTTTIITEGMGTGAETGAAGMAMVRA